MGIGTSPGLPRSVSLASFIYVITATELSSPFGLSPATGDWPREIHTGSTSAFDPPPRPASFLPMAQRDYRRLEMGPRHGHPKTVCSNAHDGGGAAIWSLTNHQ